MRRQKIAGLHLWIVQVKYSQCSGKAYLGLYITTARNVIDDAIKKARTVIKKNPGQWPNAVIDEVKYKGTLDA